MSDLVYTLMLIGGFLVLALVLRVAEHWCQAHLRRSETVPTRVGHDERS